ncbi:hypothetical protein MCAMS1_02391 [biofilm metagenome]
MGCSHKFADNLLLEHLDFKPTTLIVGTFNPGWGRLENTAEWFYGRTRNNYFWDVLPRLHGEKSLRQATPAEWKTFCKQYRIALTDLIASINDADSHDSQHHNYLQSYRDDLIVRHFHEFSFVNIQSLFARHPTLTQVCLTRSINEPFWRQLWQPVIAYDQQHGIKVTALLTPSGSARFQVPKGAKVSLPDFILEQWRKAGIKTNVLQDAN